MGRTLHRILYILSPLLLLLLHWLSPLDPYANGSFRTEMGETTDPDWLVMLLIIAAGGQQRLNTQLIHGLIKKNNL